MADKQLNSVVNQLGLGAAAKFAGVSPQTVKRWATHGVKGVCLAASKVGGRWRTTEADLAEFVRLTTAAAMPRKERSPAQQTAASRQAVEWWRRERVIGKRQRNGKATQAKQEA